MDLKPEILGTEVVLHGYLGRINRVSKKLAFTQLLDPSLRTSVQLLTTAKSEGINSAGESNGLRSTRGHNPHGIVQTLNESTPVWIRGLVKGRKPSGKAVSFDGTTRIDDIEIELLEIAPLNTFPGDLVKYTKDVAPPADQRNLQLRLDPTVRHALRTRQKAAGICRNSLDQLGFEEVETPLLFKSTPEGAREFLVPTRQKGLAYALPQSPQQYKQILVASGISRYYQFARCFRDEDLRADRQPEFTQLDMEMAFATGKDVMKVIEKVIRQLWLDLLNITLPVQFPSMAFHDAMAKYGSDKPDRRFGMEIERVDYMLPVDLVSKITSLNSPAVDMLVLSCFDRPQTTQKFIRNFMESKEAADAGVLTNPDGQPGIFIFDSRKPLSGLQPFGFEAAEVIEEKYKLKDGDLVVMQARPDSPFAGGSTALGRIRLALHREAVTRGHLQAPEGFDFLWVKDFPMFSPNNEDPGQRGSAGFSSTHHPFTAPKSIEDIAKLETDPTSALSEHYDLVVNGVELGGGSRRIHNATFQEHVLRNILKMSDAGVEEFRHLLDVLRAGCPPHAGIALGFDRLVAVLVGKSSIKDVIAFPKNSRGEDLLVKSPAVISQEQLETYHLALQQ